MLACVRIFVLAKWCDHLWQMMILKVLRAAGVGIYALDPICNIPTIRTNTTSEHRVFVEHAYFYDACCYYGIVPWVCDAYSWSCQVDIQLVVVALILNMNCIAKAMPIQNGSYRMNYISHSARFVKHIPFPNLCQTYIGMC